MKPKDTQPRTNPTPRKRKPAQASTPSSRLDADLETILEASAEAGHISVSDLKGEIAMLRVVLRRVFTLASEEAAELEERALARQEEARAGGYQQASFLAQEPGPETEAEMNSLGVWVQTLESLSQGAMRLANLMRAHQTLNREKAAIPAAAHLEEKPESEAGTKPQKEEGD